MDDNALGQRDYDSEDEMEQNGAPLDIQAEDMFPSLQSATSGATAPASPPLPQGSDGPSLAAATTTYPSTEDAVANLTMNFARAVALQPTPGATTRPLGNGSYGLDSTRRMPPPAPVHRPLYHKAGAAKVLAPSGYLRAKAWLHSTWSCESRRTRWLAPGISASWALLKHIASTLYVPPESSRDCISPFLLCLQW